MLTEKAIAAAKPKEKVYRLADKTGNGLYLQVTPSGGKRWRFRYRHDGKEKMISLGVYPDVSLREAREKAMASKQLVADGVDPSVKRRVDKGRGIPLFKDAAAEWWEKFQKPRPGKYPVETWSRLERDVLPFIGDKPLSHIDAPLVLGLLRRIESRGVIETAHKTRGHISQILQYGIACGHILTNPARDLAGALSPRRRKSMAAIIDPKKVGALMRAIDGYEGAMVRCALQLQALTFVRPGELRTAEWAEIIIDDAEWRIPEHKMKMKKAHIVPLSKQSLAVLGELFAMTGSGRYLFPSVRSAARPMSDMTVNAALRALGYGSETMTGHGFRAMATSLLSELGWNESVIERQLAHVEKDATKAAYHRAKYLSERKRMMQAWADYLDRLKAGNGV